MVQNPSINTVSEPVAKTTGDKMISSKPQDSDKGRGEQSAAAASAGEVGGIIVGALIVILLVVLTVMLSIIMMKKWKPKVPGMRYFYDFVCACA